MDYILTIVPLGWEVIGHLCLVHLYLGLHCQLSLALCATKEYSNLNKQ